MSRKEGGSGRPDAVLGDADLFFFFLKGGVFEAQAEAVVRDAEEGSLLLRTSSEVYDDVISAIRAEGTPLDVVKEFVADMKAIRHVALPMSAEVAEDALAVYLEHGGRRKLSYFDSFHVATARRYDLPLLTSDRYILENGAALGIRTLPLQRWGGKAQD